jgi:hypothetical protein
MNSNNTSSEISISDSFEPCFLNKLSEFSLLGEFSDTFNKILIGVLVISNPLTHLWDNVEGIKVVDLLQAWHFNFRKF